MAKVAPPSRPSKFKRMLGEMLGRHPWDQTFIDDVRERVRQRCLAVPCHVHKVRNAELRLEEAAREAIVEVFLEEFDEAWFPLKVRNDWPIADCIIAADEASIRISFSPETNALMGGDPIEAIKITVQRAPPNILKRAVDAMFRSREPLEPPTGKPTLELSRVIDHDTKANPKSPPVQKPLQSQARQPANSGTQVKPSVALTEPKAKPPIKR